jgi:hypothetical protein
MSCKVYCDWSSAQLEVAPLKSQAEIVFINKGIANCGILVLL